MQAGDRERLRVIGPDGASVVDRVGEASPKRFASHFTFVGKRRGVSPWPAGVYLGEYALERESGGRWQIVLTIERSVEVR